VSRTAADLHILPVRSAAASKRCGAGARQVYDVTPKADMYGIGGPYSYMAGKDASRILAKMATKDDSLAMDSCAIDDLDDKEQKTLDQWIAMFQKYEVLGNLI
jgi:membrane-associated progesterone receptor component